MQNIVIVGATSAIAHAAARLWAERGARLLLAARDPARLEDNAADLRVRGAAEVRTFIMDATDDGAQAALLDTVAGAMPVPDVALIAHGSLPDQRTCETDMALLRQTLDVNGVSACVLAQRFANRMTANGCGTIALIGSVAGDRGRQSNYAYGAAKGLVTRFAEGLRNRCHAAGVQVLTVKPGFVDTPMTAAIAGKGLLWAQPEAVAAGILRAIDRRRDVVYLPGFWRLILLLIRHVPERLFKRLSL